MSATDILSLIAGIAMFLFGMNSMSRGLEKLAGGKLEKILEKMTDNPLKAVGLGILITVLVQSSGATTVMVVGFVNSGLMQLSQAIGVIMGANIGTTVTAWLLSLAGLDNGGNVLLTIISPTGLGPILALVGIILIMASKRQRNRNIGGILMGLAILLIGMTTMTNAVAPLAEQQIFRDILATLRNPILGVLAGAIITLIVQSSAASVGILQAVAISGAMPYAVAMPIIMGQNIGTCAHSLVSSIGANKGAKRAAMIHLYFNLLGTIIFLVLFYLGDWLIGFSFADQNADAAGIATVHSVFNIVTTLLLLPFSKLLEKLAILTVPDKAGDDEFELLDDRFLTSPGVAVEQCRKVTVNMAELAHKNLLLSFDTLWNYSEKAEDETRKNEDLLDDYEDHLGTYLVKLSRKELSEKESREVSKLLHCITDFERIGDHALNLMHSGREMKEKGLHFSDSALREITKLIEAEKEILSISVSAFSADDEALAGTVEPLEQVIDEMIAEIRDRHINRLKGGECTIELGFVLSDMLVNFERVSDHCSNIGVCVIRVDSNAFDTHSYLNTVKANETEFKQAYENYLARFALPAISAE